MTLIATIPPEIIPSVSTFLKLKTCDYTLFMDYMPFSKKHPFNICQITTTQNITIPIHKGENYNDVRFVVNNAWKRKFLHSIDKFYSHKPYYIFFSKPLKRFIISTQTQSYTTFCYSFLLFFTRFLSLKSHIKKGSNIIPHFDLFKILNHFDAPCYFVEKEYSLYLKKNNNTFQIKTFQTKIKTPGLWSEKIPQNIPFLELFFDWGPYTNQLIDIA